MAEADNMSGRNFVQPSPGFWVDEDYKSAFSQAGLNSVDAVFSFEGDYTLSKPALARHRSRIRFEISNPATTLFLKRYENPPVFEQIKNWISHRCVASTMFYDLDAALKLAAAGINTPRPVCYGRQWGLFFEKQSFIVTEQIPGESLERLLPDCFAADANENLKERRKFIAELAQFAGKFHNTGYRHRDFYFAHIFHHNGDFYLIDLQRASRPLLLAKRYRIKDVAQLSYSAPKKYFSRTDRLRFYLAYAAKAQLGPRDKVFIQAVLRKMSQMAEHDRKHNRIVPFEN
jgi:tRNA A-37 threonylcarbamoyl transferase component Bud32